MLQPKELNIEDLKMVVATKATLTEVHNWLSVLWYQTLESKWIDSRQIEAARVALNRYMNRQGQVWIRISLISQSLASLLMSVWVKVRVIQQDGLHLLHQVEFSSKLKELVSILQRRSSPLRSETSC